MVTIVILVKIVSPVKIEKIVKLVILVKLVSLENKVVPPEQSVLACHHHSHRLHLKDIHAVTNKGRAENFDAILFHSFYSSHKVAGRIVQLKVRFHIKTAKQWCPKKILVNFVNCWVSFILLLKPHGCGSHPPTEGEISQRRGVLKSRG